MLLFNIYENRLNDREKFCELRIHFEFFFIEKRDNIKIRDGIEMDEEEEEIVQIGKLEAN